MRRQPRCWLTPLAPPRQTLTWRRQRKPRRSLQPQQRTPSCGAMCALCCGTLRGKTQHLQLRLQPRRCRLQRWEPGLAAAMNLWKLLEGSSKPSGIYEPSSNGGSFSFQRTAARRCPRDLKPHLQLLPRKIAISSHLQTGMSPAKAARPSGRLLALTQLELPTPSRLGSDARAATGGSTAVPEASAADSGSGSVGGGSRDGGGRLYVAALDVWDGLTLEYSPPWPLHLLLTPEVDSVNSIT